MKIRFGRKLLFAILCLAVLVVLGVFGKCQEVGGFVVALYTAYTAGNVTTKFANNKKEIE